MIRKYIQDIIGTDKPSYVDVLLVGLLPVSILVLILTILFILILMIHYATDNIAYRWALGIIIGYLALSYLVYKRINK